METRENHCVAQFAKVLPNEKDCPEKSLSKATDRIHPLFKNGRASSGIHGTRGRLRLIGDMRLKEKSLLIVA